MITSPRILIAEDDPAFRRVISYTLERAGWDFTAVNDGQTAWEALQQPSFHCLVTDHQMPGLSGLELIERVRTLLVGGENLEIILCTAKGLEFDAQGLVDRYRLLRVLHKPFSPRLLASLLTERFGSRLERAS